MMESVGERTRARNGPRDHMRAVAPDVVLVLGDVGEMREIAECADDRERLVGGEAVERGFQFAPRAELVVAMEADRGPADPLDELESLLALLLAHRVAEDAAQKADVLAQRAVLVRVVRGLKGDLGCEGHERVHREFLADVALGKERRKRSKLRASGAVGWSRNWPWRTACARPRSVSTRPIVRSVDPRSSPPDVRGDHAAVEPGPRAAAFRSVAVDPVLQNRSPPDRFPANSEKNREAGGKAPEVVTIPTDDSPACARWSEPSARMDRSSVCCPPTPNRNAG